MASSDSGGAAQPVALSKTVQTLIDAIKDLGKMPKRNTGTSKPERAENMLALRYFRHKDKIPDEILQELQALDGAPQPVELSNTVEAIVEEI